MNNLEHIKLEFDNLKGQLVLSHFNVYRFIGICEDEDDYYYCLYDGRTLKLSTILTRITPLKGFINDRDYNEMVRLCKLNHYDQPTLYGSKEDMTKFNSEHIKELTSNWDENTKVIGNLYWGEIK